MHCLLEFKFLWLGLPVIAYFDGISLSKQQIHELNVCWDNAYIKIFGFKAFKPVKELIYLMQRIDFRKLYDLRRLMFLHKLAYLQHDVISHLLSLLRVWCVRK